MLRLSILDFLSAGQFGPLQLGVTGESLSTVLGEPCSIDRQAYDDRNYEHRRWGCFTTTSDRQGRVNTIVLFFIASNDYPTVSEKVKLELGGIDWPKMDLEGMEQLLDSLEVWHFRNKNPNGLCPTLSINGTMGAIFEERDNRCMLFSLHVIGL